MEINDSGRLKHQRLHKIVASEYESSLAKAQDIKPPRQEPNISPSINEDNIIKGEIIDLRLHDVKIRLEPSGQVITAKVSAKLPLSIGQLANFIVSDKTGDQITLKLISSDTTPINDLVYKALYSAGLATSDKNLNLVQELLKYNMPVDKKTLMSLIKLTSTYPDTDITTLTLMYKNNLPINTSSVAQFESYQQGTHQILNELNSLADIIPNTIFDIQKSDDNTIDLTNAYKSEEVVISSNDKCHSPHLVSADTDNLLSLHKEILNIIRDGENRQIEYITNRELKHIFTENELIQLQDALNLTYLPDSMTLTELYHHVSNL